MMLGVRAMGWTLAGLVASFTLSFSAGDGELRHQQATHAAKAPPSAAASRGTTPAHTTPARPRGKPTPPKPLAAPSAGDVNVAPRGERIALDEPLRLRFAERPANMKIQIEPEAPLKRRWTDALTLELAPERWKPGRRYQVHVQAGSLEKRWSFRTRIPYPGGVVPGNGGCLVLSFDDGPSERGAADQLLDILAEGSVRAVFFPTGSWAQQVPAWVERARGDGHLVCNHTRSHVDLTRPHMTEARIRAEIQGGAGHGQCKLLRPPEGAWNARVQKVAEALGYQPYLWDIDSRDWDAMPVLDLVNGVLGQARPGKVVLLHMHAEGVLQALPRIIKWLTASGYVLSHDAAECGSQGLVGTRGWGEWPQHARR